MTKVVCGYGKERGRYPNDDASPDLLLRHADQAMYEAKQAGRDQIKCFDTKRDQRTQKTYSLINGVSKAIENDELFLGFQPKVVVTNGDIIGAEALIRWPNNISPHRRIYSDYKTLPSGKNLIPVVFTSSS